MLSRWVHSNAGAVQKSLQKPLKGTLWRGAIAGVLGAVVGLAYSSQAGVPRPEEVLWTFTVDQCVDDSYAPEIQRVGGEVIDSEVVGGEAGGSSTGGASDRSAKNCPRKVLNSTAWSGMAWSGAIPFQGLPKSTTEEPVTIIEGDDQVETVTITERDDQVTDLDIQGLSESGAVQFKYSRSGNCCSQIQLIPKRREQVLEVLEQDTTDQHCRCRCDYEAEGVIDNLEPGEYTLRVLTLRDEAVGEGRDRQWVKRQVVLFEGQVEL
ncbi:MAG: hypothetical protein AAGA67_11320 [Cyanobacteria bacterium P01_F01_bin.153]